MKTTSLFMVILVLACAIPALAQGPFTDVPSDHWAYDAINQLQKDGILIGYPDGTFAGKRNITRYEFAVAIARLMGIIPGAPGETNRTGLVTKAELDKAIAGIQVPSISGLATKSDVDAIKKLVDEFRDEIAALGVDVDALKRDVAALCARVDAIEAEMKRVKLLGDATVFAIGAGATEGTPIDLDNRTLNPVMLRNVSVVKDMDLKVLGRVNDTTSVVATINYGNYLNYLGFVDDFVGGAATPRPTSKNFVTGFKPATPGVVGSSLTDTFFPYYLYVDAGICSGALTVGRFPLQFTPYTLKMIDVDSYTTNLKTDSGNYPVDGAKLAINLWGVDTTWFAVKNDENTYLVNGLTGQPNTFMGTQIQAGALTGNAVGGLTQVTQSAGVRAVVNLPLNAVVGVTYYQAWDGSKWTLPAPSTVSPGSYDQARVYGADLVVPLPIVETLNLAGSWTRSDTLVNGLAPVTTSDLDYLNIAWDAKLSATISNLGIGAGYKDIGRNFAAAGYWDKIGPWANPVNVKGPYLDITYPVLDNLKVVLDGEYLEIKDTAVTSTGATLIDGDNITKAEAAVKWGFSKSTAIDVSYQYVKFEDSRPAFDDTKLNYLTVGFDHQLSANAGLMIGYQYINTDGTSASLLPSAKGGLGVVQFGVSF